MNPHPPGQNPKPVTVGVYPIPAEDQDRLDFLLHLDAAPFDITDWEASFLEDLVTNPRPLTPRQRAVIDDLRTRYQPRL